ncbi:hypothetical protein ONZ45_g17815 [Pleurotus djamor]|nr:hypothetical protein ONZ45_g17815 [Pleurotus djamor]
MDPHSTLSQYNQRTPKSGPITPKIRHSESAPRISTENFAKRGASTGPKSSTMPVPLVRRPIITNSRVKQDEKYRKDMFLTFVDNALQQKAMGVKEPFDELVDQFNPKRTVSEGVSVTVQLRSWLSALSHVVSRLDRSHASLVEAIVNMPARPEYLSLVLGKIAQGFTHQNAIQTLDSNAAEGSSSPLTRRNLYDRLHYLLRHLITLIPTLSSTLHPLLIRNFPHKRQNLISQTTYIRNLLRVASYCPQVSDKIMATIVDRAIQIDVEIQVELEELEDMEGPQEADVFELDPFDTSITEQQPDSDDEDAESDGEEERLSDISSEGGDMDDASPTLDIPINAQHIHGMVKKLDAILTLLFMHFREAFSPDLSLDASISSLPPLPSSPLLDTPTTTIPSSAPSHESSSSPKPTPQNKANQRLQFMTLLSIFDRTIIKTFKSRYTQFLIFWYSSLDPEYTDLFQGLLVQKALLEHDLPAVTRAASASYIGSYVSRAQFVDREGARSVVGILCEYVKNHLDVYEMLEREEAEMPSNAHHSVFYAVVQAIFLIFCFRWRDLLADGDDEEDLLAEYKPTKKWIPGLDVIQRVVVSSLNPLKVCSSNVVTQFARVAHATNFVYCYSIMDLNKRTDYGSSRPSGTPAIPQPTPRSLDNSLNNELNTFFPFDPYRLPKSSPFIDAVYREWSSVAIDDEEDDEDDEDDGDEIPQDDLGQGDNPNIVMVGRQIEAEGHESDGEGLGASFNAMSISPAQSKIPSHLG